jgi:hypothetical protein
MPFLGAEAPCQLIAHARLSIQSRVNILQEWFSRLGYDQRMWIRATALCTLLIGWFPALDAGPLAQAPPGQLKKLVSFADGNADLYAWTDTANIYVLRDGDRALLFDLGDGSVLGKLAGIGVRTVEWVLFTHHHREQVQGSPLLAKWHPRIGAPEAERAFFETPSAWRKMKPSLSDSFAVHRPGIRKNGRLYVARSHHTMYRDQRKQPRRHDVSATAHERLDRDLW